MGKLECHVATDRLTAMRQFSCLPTCPQYCRVTPTECEPFLGNPVSSTIQATTGPCSCRRATLAGARDPAVLDRSMEPWRPGGAKIGEWPERCAGSVALPSARYFSVRRAEQ